MNELKIFENPESKAVKTATFDGRTEYVVDGKVINRFELLALASSREDEKEAWEYMNIASRLFHPQDDWAFNELYGAVAIELAWKSSLGKDEFAKHKLFKEKYSKIREGNVVERKDDGKNKPDAWVEKDNTFIPVEIKKDVFNNSALKQLERYMEAYNCTNGIAVARKCTVSLPANIEFISLEELEENT